MPFTAQESSPESPLYLVIMSPNILQAGNVPQSSFVFHNLGTFKITGFTL